MDSKQALVDKLKNAQLKPEEIELWERVLVSVTDETAKSVVDLFSERPNLISLMTENLRLKEGALKNKDLDAWKAALSHEMDMVNLVQPTT